jgi:hypothetical protein
MRLNLAPSGPGRALRRRGLMAGLAGALAGYLAKASERFAHAANGDPIVVGGNHAGTNLTQLSTTNGGSVLLASSGAGPGIGLNGRTGSGYGVLGEANAGVGAFGVSNTQFGVYGYSFGSGNAAVGVYGVANTGDGIAAISLSGTALHANAINGTAGIFDGPVIVNGNLSASGEGADGELRRVYCLEATESLFEDIGRVTLNKGGADVILDKEFADLVRLIRYDVFLTPYGECNGLAVLNRTEQGFRVQELQGGTTTGIEVGYRVAARRKDIEGRRLQRVPREKRKDFPEPPPLPNVPGLVNVPAPPRPRRGPRE